MRRPVEDVHARVHIVRARLKASASGFVRVSKMSQRDREALALMIKAREVEIIDSPVGRAYRLRVET